MNRLTQLLLDIVLLKNAGQIVRNRARRTQDWFTSIKPFSWEAMLMLSLFSWFVYLLLEGIYAKKFVSIFAWGFLIISSDWAFLGKQAQVPLLGFKFQHGAWITAAILAVALLSNNFILTRWQNALTAWPIFAALFAAYPLFLRPGLRWGLPGAAGRQDLVLLVLVHCLIACWFQFHFLIQGRLADYPYLLNNSFEDSLFITRITLNSEQAAGENTASRQAATLLTTAEATIRQALTGKTWSETYSWLSNIQSIQPNLNQQVIEAVYGEQAEGELWQITADVGRNAISSSSLDLILTARWLGASSRLGGYALRQRCLVSETSLPNPDSFAQMQQTGFQLTCQAPAEA